MPNLRHERVRELLKREIGEAIRREFHVDSVGLITVNDVDVGGDFKSAVVFISVLGNPEQQKRALTELESHRVRIQGMVGRAGSPLPARRPGRTGCPPVRRLADRGSKTNRPAPCR